jgi:L-rhamnose mutarotase
VTRLAYTIRLAPGALPEYRRLHEAIWPELVDEFRRQGIAQLTAFEADPMIYYLAEVTDPEAFERLFQTDVHDRWAALFGSLIAFEEDGSVAAPFLTEIFHLETRA